MLYRTPRPFREFFYLQSAGGVVLMACAIVALIWANSPAEQLYHTFWHVQLGNMSIHQIVNDGLMAIFFLVVGLEIKREITEGQLSSIQQAALPIAAALGGMIIPALIYSAFNSGSAGAAGWGIPMATDIAFALGVLALLGTRVPRGLKIFLSALAIVDDLGAVLVIAIFYTRAISWLSLLSGFGVLSALLTLSRLKFQNAFVYLGGGILVWTLFFNSGVHATVAGVLLACVIPSQVGARLEKILHPWVSFGIMPLFALANAGVHLSTSTLFEPVSLGVIAGLVFGKQIGITLFAWAGVKIKMASLPENVRWRQIYGVGWLGGIGFTMSLFIANLAFERTPLLESAKMGILVGSLISGTIGASVLLISSGRRSLLRDRFKL